jgi:hypothetical protein
MPPCGSIITKREFFHFNADSSDEITIHPDNPTRHIHSKAMLTRGGGRAPEDQEFYHHVSEAIADAGVVLITGPANAKLELMKHLSHDHPQLAARVAAVETVDHPSDGALVAHARHYFKLADRMRPQRG